MAIFTNTTEEVMVPGIEPTIECAQEILYEFNEGVSSSLSALYVSDIMIEQAISEGATNEETLVEATMKETLDKVKQFFVNLLQKIRTWFRSVINNLTNITKHISKWATANEEEIKKNKNNSKCEEKVKEIDYVQYKKLPEDILDNIHISLDYAKKTIQDTFKDDEVRDINKMNETNILSQPYRKCIEHFKTELYGEGQEPKLIIAKYNDSMLTSCKDAPKILENVKKVSKKCEDIVSDILKSIKDGSSKVPEDRIKELISFYKQVATNCYSISTLIVSLVQKHIKQDFDVLKCYIKYSDKKENNTSVPNNAKDKYEQEQAKKNNGFIDESYTSIFEAAYSMI